MMKIKTLILDDDENARGAAAQALSAYDEVELCGNFSNANALFAYLESNDANLLFLDIELNGETGFDVASRLRETAPEIMIVFLTGFSSYAIDGYDFQPINFLTKPINPRKLANTIDEVCRRLAAHGQRQREAKIMFQFPRGYRVIDVRDICYVERSDRKNIMVLSGETVRIANYTMSELEKMLSPHGFFLCHQSFIVSLFKVEQVRDIRRQLYELVVTGADKPIPVSRHRYEQLMKKLAEIRDSRP